MDHPMSDTSNMSFSENEFEPAWVRFPKECPVEFVGKDTVCIGRGCYLYFLNLSNKEEHIYAANSRSRGDGIKCYAGHRQLPVFAFAEKCLKPRVFFVSYPGFQIIQTFNTLGAPEGYLTMTFSDQEYFFTLSSLPVFEFVVWNWRTLEKLAAVETKTNNIQQNLKCNYTSPTIVAQYNEDNEKLIIWEIQPAYKQCLLVKRDIKLPYCDNIINCTWSLDGQFFVLNNAGAVYILTPEYNLEFVSHGPKFSGLRQCFAWHKNGFFIAEQYFGIQHVKKDGELIAHYNTKSIGFHQLISNGRDILIGWTNNSQIMELDMNQNCFVLRKSLCNDLLHLCPVYPSCDYFVAMLTDYETLTAYETTTGIKESSISMNHKIAVINSNPVFPYVLAALETGTLVFVSFFQIKSPSVMCQFRINRHKIDRFVFTESGATVVTGNTNLGCYFILQVIPGQPIRILNCIEYQRCVLDFCVMEDKFHYKIIFLATTEERLHVSSKIVMKTIVKMSGVVKKKNFKSPVHGLRSIRVIGNVFHATVFGKEVICRFLLHKNKIEFMSDLNHQHFTTLVTIAQDSLHLITYGFNGFICIRDKTFKPEVFLIAHHRADTGVSNVIADPFMRYAISRGRKEEIVCLKIYNHADKYEKKYKETIRLQFDIGQKFSKPTLGFFPDEDITYMEKKQAEIAEKEAAAFATERKSIMNEFLALKSEVVSLLEANLNGPELEKIDILEFYLHVKLREHRERIAELEAEWTVTYYKELIRAQTALWNCMKTKFWDTQLVKRSVIKGILSNFEVENYGLVAEDPEMVDQLKYVLMFREFEEMLKAGDIFQPWVPATDGEILLQLEKSPTICHKSESTRILEALEDLENEEESIVTKKESYPSSNEGEIMEKHLYYDQAEIHTYSQFAIQLQLTACANRELRTMFNAKFDEMMQLKIKEMNNFIDKNNRLRFILSELKNNTICIEDPEWHLEEKPENIITVQEHEICVLPYISPSRQAQLDWQAAEEERIRLLLLADDFREKALIKMMDGVLEVRWEDTLKRDVPKPKCMLEKDPETFNEEDLRAIKDYEEKCTFLNIERQRYKNMLESEYGRTAEVVKETAKKFNNRLRDLLLTKIRTESTRGQHLLLLQLTNQKLHKRIEMRNHRNSIKEKIALNDKEIIAFQENVSELNDGLLECKANYEVLASKEKILEKNFKKDYEEYSALIQEQGYKLYRRQPRVHLKNMTMASVIAQLAACCVTQEKSLVLNPECLDFLRSLDVLDQYVGVPNTIDENMYKIICKHRRLKIENELKMKANQIELSNIELSIQMYQKFVNEKKEKIIKLANDLQTARVENLQFIHDKNIQLVVKRGLVEIPLTGFINDFQNAVMVNRKEVEYVNSLIMKAGERKIKVMTDKMVHRRQILMKEWQHKKMKMEIEDLKDYLCTVEKVKVTKEIQRYLRQRAKGEQFDKGTLTLDQEIECRKSIFEKTLNEKQNAIKELDRQIKEFKKSNKLLDQKIAEVNVDVCEQEGNIDVKFEEENEQLLKKRMGLIVRRSRLVKQIQDQHNEILILQTELELLRLKTYPTLKFKTL